MTTLIEPERIQLLNQAPERSGDYVLYWMQQSQRAHGNSALELAVAKANELRLPLLVCFVLKADYPEANARHFTFLLQGLAEVARDLSRRDIAFVIRKGEPHKIVPELAQDAAVVIVDRAYLRHLREWRQQIAKSAHCQVIQVEDDAVVPVELASNRLEIAARTLRPKVNAHLSAFLRPPADETRLRAAAGEPPISDIDLTDVKAAVEKLGVDQSVRPVHRFIGGNGEAHRRLRKFVDDGLFGYADNRNEPGLWQCSQLSPYLHFGQISPTEVALAARASPAPSTDRDSFIEELVVRRELGLNFVTYQPNYDHFEGLPNWAKQTLSEHAEDERPYRYTAGQVEAGDTHDAYWNAAVREMVHTGYMHNYMRMYWAKKILEWSPSPRSAFRTVLRLMNKYFLDGRDPLSYSNVAWCFGQHDRPWPERPVYGRVRSMVQSGLERKFDMDRYVEAVDRLVADEYR